MGLALGSRRLGVLTDGTTTFTPGISNRTGTTSKWEHPDHLGSNIRQTAAAETVTSTLRFDAFGNLAAATGTHAGPFGFAGGHGYQADNDSGLMLLGHRYYDSSTGRFLTRDPIKDGRNWYVYSESNPVGDTDGSGLSKVIDIIRRAIAKGQLPPGTAGRYGNDKPFRDSIHREIGDRKMGGGKNKKNPDLPDDEVLEIIRDIIEEMSPPPTGGNLPSETGGGRGHGGPLEDLTPRGEGVDGGGFGPVDLLIFILPLPIPKVIPIPRYLPFPRMLPAGR